MCSSVMPPRPWPSSRAEAEQRDVVVASREAGRGASQALGTPRFSNCSDAQPVSSKRASLYGDRLTVSEPMVPRSLQRGRCARLVCQRYGRRRKASLCPDTQP
jgi:hypothetical protein